MKQIPLVLLVLIALFLFTCDQPEFLKNIDKQNQESKKIAEETRKLTEKMEKDAKLRNNLLVTDTVFLKFILGMTEKEFANHEKKLIDSGKLKYGPDPVMEDLESLHTELSVIPDAPKSKVFYQSFFEKNFLINFDALFTGDDLESLRYYLIEIYKKKYGEPSYTLENFNQWYNPKFNISINNFSPYGIKVSYTDKDPDFKPNLEEEKRIEETLEDI